jgi:uncharacterized protein
MGRGGFEPPKALGQLIYSQSRLTTSVSARPGDFTDNRWVPKRCWVLWEGLVAASMERMLMTESGTGFELAGVIIQAAAGASYLARYTVHVHPDWRTLDASAEVDDGTTRKLVLVRTPSGEWIADGKAMPGLGNCVDVDLEWTPATNTLPIRRLALTPGKQATVKAAWIRFPDLRVEALTQSYERFDDRRYRYESGTFQADLEVDENGLVLQYGANWRAVASGAES